MGNGDRSAALFDLPAAPPVPKLSADRRRTIRQRQAVEQGVHPLSPALDQPLRLHSDENRTCGNCEFRSVGNPRNGRHYPKCLWRPTDTFPSYPRVSKGAGTDVRAWWPACETHEYADG